MDWWLQVGGTFSRRRVSVASADPRYCDTHKPTSVMLPRSILSVPYLFRTWHPFQRGGWVTVSGTVCTSHTPNTRASMVPSVLSRLKESAGES